MHKGARVGITANSHKVIINLLDAALAAAKERGLDVRAVRKISGDSPDKSDDDRVMLETGNRAVFEELAGACQIGAGTAWLWAREEARDTVDVLFVDEAAQMSLANCHGHLARRAKPGPAGRPAAAGPANPGDPPRRHWSVGAWLTCSGTARPSKSIGGCFWRRHGDFIPKSAPSPRRPSNEDKLSSRSGLEVQRLVSSGPVTGTGLRFLPVVHHGNQSFSEEEADQVAALVSSLVEQDASWVDKDGREKADHLG